MVQEIFFIDLEVKAPFLLSLIGKLSVHNGEETTGFLIRVYAVADDHAQSGAMIAVNTNYENAVQKCLSVNGHVQLLCESFFEGQWQLTL